MLRVHVEEARGRGAGRAASTSWWPRVRAACLPPPSKPRSPAYISSLIHELDEDGHRLVVRNGHAEPRSLVTGAGPLEVRAPRVNDRRIDEETGERMRFSSSILPPWARKSPKVAEVLPLMYLHGMSSGDFVPALEEFFGSAAGLSASVITRLTTDWQHERDQFAHRSLKDVTTSMSSSTASTSTCGSKKPVCAPWSSWVCAATGPKSWSRSPTGTASRPSRWADVLRGPQVTGHARPGSRRR